MTGATASKRQRPERYLALGFLTLILLGATLLSLPIASSDGESHGVVNALFTATSAVCVTGLVTLDTATAWSLFGQSVLLVLIQVGGLGFMVFATLIMVIMGKRITLKNRMLIRESMNASSLSGLVRLSLIYGALALVIELVGAAILSLRFVPQYGWQKGLFFSLFHAVSAFCNAGFDLFGQFSSLTAYQKDPLVLITISLLIILGGLGFSVIFETLHIRRFKKLSLHARLVLILTAVLLFVGFMGYMLLEWRNPLTLGAEDLSISDRLINAWFQSTTMRTAGFNSLDLGNMTDSSKFLSVLLMFVGAAPASTGGGVKITTMGVMFFVAVSVLRGREQITVFKRRLSVGLVRRAITILFISLFILMSATLALATFENGRFSFIDLLFESTSALATVGVSALGTPHLSLGSQCLLIPVMFFGRVGPLTLALALANRQEKNKDRVTYPEENIMIG
ncbi:MAG: Trk family potassium uptake protein [Clostridia bacterium]|nr:Trk family potassium uptake protein [Clostridia bacterium]